MRHQQANICAAVLAAGLASRFGATKQAVELHGTPLVRRAVAAATKVCGDRVVTVIGHDWPGVMAAMRANSGFVVMNDAYQSGLGSSIATAARACGKCARAMLLLFADQPLVTAQHLEALIGEWSGSDDEIVATSFGGTRGPPVLFPRATFGALCQLRGDTGARTLFDDDRYRLTTVHFEDAAIDIDTPADLAALI